MRILWVHMCAVLAACKEMLEVIGFARTEDDTDTVRERAESVLGLAESMTRIIDKLRFTSDYWMCAFYKVRVEAVNFANAARQHLTWCDMHESEDWYGMMGEARRLIESAADHVQDAHACVESACFKDVLLSTTHAQALTRAAKSLCDAIPISDATLLDTCTDMHIVAAEAEELRVRAYANIYSDNRLFGDPDASEPVCELADDGIVDTHGLVENAAERAFFGPVPTDLTGVR